MREHSAGGFRRHVVMAVAVAIASLVLARDGFAQTMNFSVYTDGFETGDGLYLDSDATVIDDSTGCTHSGYYTSTRITSPSGRYSQTQEPGLSSSTSLAIDDEFGDYTLDTEGTYVCSCIFYNTAMFGGPAQTVTTRTPTDLVKSGDDTFTSRSIGDYTRGRTWQVLDQSGAPWNYGGAAVNENYTPVAGQNGCNIQIRTAQTTTNSNGAFSDCYGNCSGSETIPACTTLASPNCTSAFTQTITVAGKPFNVSVTYGCWDVTVVR